MGNLKLAAFCVQHAAFMNDTIKNSSRNSNDRSASNGRLLSSRITNKANNKNVSSQLDSRATNQSTISTINISSSFNTVNQMVTQQALVYLFLKNFKKAVDILERELKIKPSTEIYNLLGRVNMKSKNWQAAVDAFDKSIAFNVKPNFFYKLHKINGKL
jgi:tetratricopeptide (TPR) repeat protein